MSDNVTSKQLLDHYARKVYADAAEAKAAGRPVGWSTAIVPQEFFETMDLPLVYPENHSAVISARKRALGFLERAEGYGYHADVCGYMRVNFGYLLEGARGDDDVPPAPVPDFVVCCNNYCTMIVKWYENLAKELGVPLFMIDMPYNPEGAVDEARVRYIRAQFDRLVGRLEDLTGRSFDRERFREVMEFSGENARLWMRAFELVGHVPSPANGFDFYNYLTLMVFMRGRAETTEVLYLWIREMEGKIAGARAVPGWRRSSDHVRRHRLLAATRPHGEGLPLLGHQHHRLQLPRRLGRSTRRATWTAWPGLRVRL